MRNTILAPIVASTLAFTSNTFSESTIKATLQLPKTHSLGQNWKEFAKIVKRNLMVSSMCNYSHTIISDRLVRAIKDAGMGEFLHILPCQFVK